MSPQGQASDLLDPAYAQFRDQTRFWVQRVAVPLIMVIGLFGNLITVIIMTRRRMRSTTNMYLAALAFVDMLYLVLTFLLGLSHYPNMAARRYYLYWELRPFLMMLTDACSNTSVWLTVTFTIERYIAVKYPMKGKVWCTEARAKKLISSVFLFGLICASPVPFEWKVIEKQAKPTAVAERNNQTSTGSATLLADSKLLVPLSSEQQSDASIVPISTASSDETSASRTTTNGSSSSGPMGNELIESPAIIVALDYSDFGRNETYKTIYYWSTAVIFYFIPLLSLTLFNGFLIRSVHQSQKERNKMTSRQSIVRHPTTNSKETKQSERMLQKGTSSTDLKSKVNVLVNGKSNQLAASNHRSHLGRASTNSVDAKRGGLKLFLLPPAYRDAKQDTRTPTLCDISPTNQEEHSSQSNMPLIKGATRFASFDGQLVDGRKYIEFTSNSADVDLLGGEVCRINSDVFARAQNFTGTGDKLSDIEKENSNGPLRRRSDTDPTRPITLDKNQIVVSGQKTPQLHDHFGTSSKAARSVEVLPTTFVNKSVTNIRLIVNSSPGSISGPVPNQSTPASSQERRITIMLIAVVILFLFCQIPTAAMLIYTSVHETSPNTNEHALVLAFGNIFNFLMAVNAAGNFILYSFLSKKYRKTFLIIFCNCIRSHNNLRHPYQKTTQNQASNNTHNRTVSARSRPPINEFNNPVDDISNLSINKQDKTSYGKRRDTLV